MTTNQIRQTEAAIKLLELQVKAGRARVEQLEPLQKQLSELKKADKQLTPPPPPKAATPTKTAKKPNAYAEKQAELSKQANELRKEQAKLSNLLHKVPPHQDCPELTQRIVDLQVQIEDLWDEKKFIERNGLEPAGEFRALPEKKARPLDDVQHKAVLTVELQRLREKRSKLTRKLENPKAADSKKAEWSTELAKISSQIEQATAERYVL
ncbi:hypothetical protein [Arundinibacter roseus]|uniref:Uncharacterized protein n=1 Tax=Arundinibacter roseus TaxID=2070510 RepID=A0A4R4KR19_9BACT|nr:hypothetical protein [Arundinibacter roseus]TDB69099.1 hypothetical protein EZE20_01825 [Arundinibacter roseus]